MLRPLFLFLFIVSCGSLKTEKINEDLSVDQILSAVPMVGEGRGRIGIKGRNFVFAFDALLKENNDWLLSATIPMHGEELMIFPDLKSKHPVVQEESFEQRIERMFQQELGDKNSGSKVVQELRGLIRFMLSAKLGLNRECEQKDVEALCSLSSESVYTVKNLSEKKISIHREIGTNETIQVEGESFQDGRFLRTNFFFLRKGDRLFSLELIWK